MFDQFTLGIEEEFQIIDPETRELRSHVSEILDEGRMLLGEQIKPEMIQSQIEVGTGICKNIQEARADITNLRSVISTLAAKNGLRIVAASTHPISRWQDSRRTHGPRFSRNEPPSRRRWPRPRRPLPAPRAHRSARPRPER